MKIADERHQCVDIPTKPDLTVFCHFMRMYKIGHSTNSIHIFLIVPLLLWHSTLGSTKQDRRKKTKADPKKKEGIRESEIKLNANCVV